MALPDGLLNPIPGENPGGMNLRYDPVLDKIKEARREEEALPQGAWTYEIKKADYPLVIRLATDVLTSKSKDLQIAAWLTEALVAQDRIAGLRDGLDLIRGLIENFWDTLYPEIDEGDLGMRAAAIEWVGLRLDPAIRKVPLTKNKLSWLKYQESRLIGYEEDVKGNESKTLARQQAIAEKKCTAEEFDEAAKLTGVAYYQQLTGDLAAALQSLEALETLSDQKLGRDAPSFKNLRAALEDLQSAVKHYYRPAEESAETTQVEEPTETAAAPEVTAPAAEQPAKVRKKTVASEEPTDREDALRRVVHLAEFLRKENPRNPVPYLLLRAVRWGELRETAGVVNAGLFESPPTEVRQLVKKLATDGQWVELLEAAESAMGMGCGRSWLDLQRHTVRACEGLGAEFEPVAAAVRTNLRGLLADYPDLVTAMLLDDTPAANAETQAWLRASILPPPAPPPVEVEEKPRSLPSTSAEQAPDVHELALQTARAGHVEDAIQMLMREIAQEKSGRARFQRTIQLAALCLSTKHELIAYPILAELAEEVERRKLEEWEEASAVAHPLALLYRCLEKMGGSEAEKQKVYQKLCRLDPVQALACSR